MKLHGKELKKNDVLLYSSPGYAWTKAARYMVTDVHGDRVDLHLLEQGAGVTGKKTTCVVEWCLSQVSLDAYAMGLRLETESWLAEGECV